MICNTCGCYFMTFPREADPCPKCTSTDLRVMEPTDERIYGRIWSSHMFSENRLKEATRRLKSLRAKKSEYPARLVIQEGWIDDTPGNESTEVRFWLGLSADDNYGWYARCDNYEFQGFRTADEAKNALVSHCNTCSERKEGCWKPVEESSDLTQRRKNY